MPTFHAEALTALTQAIFAHQGFPEGEAATIAELMVAANLRGHDSHGFRNIPAYLRRIAGGGIVPGGTVRVVRETPTTAVIEGGRTLGHVAAARAVELGLAKARAMQLSAVAVRDLEHVGRIGAYPERIAEAGFIGLAFVNAQGFGRLVSPFGGQARRLGTNPVAAAFPNPPGRPVLLDVATSTVAANKVRLAAERGAATGEGWIADAEGRPTTAPADFLEALGWLLPLGGESGHKGYALAVMVDILGGILAGSGTAAAEKEHLDNGTFLLTIDPEAFLPRAEYEAQVAGLCAYLRDTPPRPGGPPVEVPGDYEARHLAERSAHGIAIEEGVWMEIAGLVEGMGITPPDPLA